MPATTAQTTHSSTTPTPQNTSNPSHPPTQPHLSNPNNPFAVVPMTKPYNFGANNQLVKSTTDEGVLTKKLMSEISEIKTVQTVHQQELEELAEASSFNMAMTQKCLSVAPRTTENEDLLQEITAHENELSHFRREMAARAERRMQLWSGEATQWRTDHEKRQKKTMYRMYREISPTPPLLLP